MDSLTITTTIRQDKTGRYCLNDPHRAASEEQRHQPRYWLANQQTQELIVELENSGNPLFSQIRGNSVIKTTKGRNGGTLRQR